jgi:hypothetical protein
MKKSSLLLLTFALAMGTIAQSEAIALRIGVPGIMFSNQQPIQVVIVDGSGSSYEQTVYYNPAIGGVDLNASWAGPNASIYIPSLGTGYLWANGFWVDQDGYYWNGDQRIFINNPHWHDHWSGYWHAHPHEHWRHGERFDRDHRDWNERDHGKVDNMQRRDFEKDQGRNIRPEEFQKGQRMEQQRKEAEAPLRNEMRGRDFDRGQNKGPADRGQRGDGRGPGGR